MSFSELTSELQLQDKVLAATLVHGAPTDEVKLSPHCIFQALPRVLAGETLMLRLGCCGCKGFDSNAGFTDAMPSIPGGYGFFLSYGAGEGFRPGERLKCGPMVSENYYEALPKDVMDGFDSIQLEPYREGMEPDLVISFVTPDQLSALAFLHDFRSTDYDRIITPTTAGCASLFRIPLAERKRSNSRAVLGNIDITTRPYLAKDLLTYAVTGKVFRTMLEDTEACFFHSPIWSRLRNRIHQSEE